MPSLFGLKALGATIVGSMIVIVTGLMVAQDDIRANTKYYPDYDRTATTIEVFIGMDSLAPDVDAGDQIRALHRAAVNGKAEPDVDDIAEAHRLIKDAGSGFDLDFKEEGWVLTDLSDQGHVFWGVPRHEVLERVRMALPAKKTPATDFDPFLDSDE